VGGDCGADGGVVSGVGGEVGVTSSTSLCSQLAYGSVEGNEVPTSDEKLSDMGHPGYASDLGDMTLGFAIVRCAYMAGVMVIGFGSSNA